MTNAFSRQNSISLPCFIPYSKAKFAVYSRCFLTSYFCIPAPYNEKDIFFGVLVLKGLVGLHRTVQLQLLQRYWLGHRLRLLWYWMVCIENKQRSFCRFWDCIQVLHFGLFVDHDGFSISSEGFLPAVVDIMVIWVNSPIPVHFSLLIPRMSTFTFAISCLTTSNLPWFMDLTFQVPMQYCSLQHRTLLLSPVTSTTRDGESERRHSRNQRTKMDWNGWI